jgi:hypothetical protein
VVLNHKSPRTTTASSLVGTNIYLEYFSLNSFTLNIKTEQPVDEAEGRGSWLDEQETLLKEKSAAGEFLLSPQLAAKPTAALLHGCYQAGNF